MIKVSIFILYNLGSLRSYVGVSFKFLIHLELFIYVKLRN